MKSPLILYMSPSGLKWPPKFFGRPSLVRPPTDHDTRHPDLEVSNSRREDSLSMNGTNVVPSPDPQGCYEKALGNAVRSANLPLLTLVYLATHTLQEAAAGGIGVPEMIAAK